MFKSLIKKILPKQNNPNNKEDYRTQFPTLDENIFTEKKYPDQIIKNLNKLNTLLRLERLSSCCLDESNLRKEELNEYMEQLANTQETLGDNYERIILDLKAHFNDKQVKNLTDIYKHFESYIERLNLEDPVDIIDLLNVFTIKEPKITYRKQGKNREEEIIIKKTEEGCFINPWLIISTEENNYLNAQKQYSNLVLQQNLREFNCDDLNVLKTQVKEYENYLEQKGRLQIIN